jgi:SAM-dependent methyltransferase
MQDLTELEPLLLDADSLVRAVASGRQRNTTVPFRRVEVRYVDLRAGRHLHVVSNDATQSHTRNLPVGPEAKREVEALLATPYANWHVETTTEIVQVRVSKKGKLLVHRAGREEARREPERGHDRAKRRRLDATDPLFRELGVTSRDGVVKPSRVAKFRQVQDLLAALDPVVDEAIALGPGTDHLSARRPLRVVDLGCGNAYLTFAAFRYLTEVRSLPVSALGVDVKAQAREHNTAVAAELGFAEHMDFVESTILDIEVAETPDLVLALHACDTATDEALARAVRWQTPVIVAAPCCHHDIQRQLDPARVPAEYRLMTRHGILKERFADVLTDTLRAAILRLLGYRVEVIEFVDSQHTPRNALIRAVRTGARASDETTAAYRRLVADWHVEPALARLLADHDPRLVALAADARD